MPGQCTGKNHDRVHRTHLGVNRNGFGTLVGNLLKRQATRPRAGETNGFDGRVRYQRLRHLVVGVEQGENAVGHPGFLSGRHDGLPH